MVTVTWRPWTLLLVVSTFAGAALAEPKARCPAGQRPGLSGCIDGSAQAKVRVRAGAAEKPSGPKPVPKPDPALVGERAKPKPLELASKALLVRELARL